MCSKCGYSFDNSFFKNWQLPWTLLLYCQPFFLQTFSWANKLRMPWIILITFPSTCDNCFKIPIKGCQIHKIRSRHWGNIELYHRRSIPQNLLKNDTPNFSFLVKTSWNRITLNAKLLPTNAWKMTWSTTSQSLISKPLAGRISLIFACLQRNLRHLEPAHKQA